ncbi:unnamed protein product, partial [Brassica rapa subsp. trilocularis]
RTTRIHRSIHSSTTASNLQQKVLAVVFRIERYQVYLKMGRYSYSQPSCSSEYGGEYSSNNTSEYSETEHLIRLDQ